ncbi:MAG: hypothetical protein WCQ26_06525 [Pseudanabaena sp. ELA748]
MTDLDIKTVEIYRSVSRAELDDLKSFGQFRVCPSGCSMESKWFALQFGDAITWGRLFYENQGINLFYVVTATIPSQLIDQMFCQDKLDNIGKAICIDADFLDQVRLIKVTQVRRK